MKAFHIVKLAVLASVIVALTACASNREAKQLGNDQGNAETAFQAYSQGAGERNGFQNEGMGHSYTTKAPVDQTYYFPYDNSTVNDKYNPSIQAQADYLKANQNARVLIAGNTDERGSASYNLGLGEQRAKSIADILRVAGVPSNQIRVVSYGKERPAKQGHDEQAWRYNRRVEFTYEVKK